MFYHINFGVSPLQTAPPTRCFFLYGLLSSLSQKSTVLVSTNNQLHMIIYQQHIQQQATHFILVNSPRKYKPFEHEFPRRAHQYNILTHVYQYYCRLVHEMASLSHSCTILQRARVAKPNFCNNALFITCVNRELSSSRALWGGGGWGGIQVS